MTNAEASLDEIPDWWRQYVFQLVCCEAFHFRLGMPVVRWGRA